MLVPLTAKIQTVTQQETEPVVNARGRPSCISTGATIKRERLVGLSAKRQVIPMGCVKLVQTDTLKNLVHQLLQLHAQNAETRTAPRAQ